MCEAYLAQVMEMYAPAVSPCTTVVWLQELLQVVSFLQAATYSECLLIRRTLFSKNMVD